MNGRAAALTLALLAAASSSSAYPQRRPPLPPPPPRADSTTRIGFKERAPLLLSARALLARRGGYQDVVLANPTTGARDVVLHLRWSGADTASRRAPVLFDNDALVDTVRVPARGEAVARLRANRLALPDERRAREGVLTSSDAGFIVERQIVLDPSRARSDSLLSPITAISYHAVRRWPFPFSEDSPVTIAGRGLLLPVFPAWDSAVAGGAEPTLSSVLQGPRGETAVLESTKQIFPLGDELHGVRLRVIGLTRPGEYVGTLSQTPLAGTVQVKVSLADHWLWAVIAILLGVLLGYKLERYTGVERADWLLRARLARITSRWATAQAAFANTLGPLGEAARRVAYAMGTDVERRRKAREEELRGLARHAFLPDADAHTKLAALATAVEELEKQIADWPGLAVALVSLHKARADSQPVFDTLRAPGGSPGKSIAIDEVANRAFIGGEIDVSELKGTIKAVADVTGTIDLWRLMCEDVQECYSWLAEGKVKGVASTELRAVEKQLIGVHHDLWTATSEAELETRQTRTTLVTAQRELLAQLAQLAQVSTPGPPSTPGKGVSGAPPRVAPKRDTSYVPPDEKAGAWERIVRAHDWALFALIMAVALASGFKLVYSDTFGTLPDYLTALLWGFGSKTGVEALATTLSKFFGR